MKNRVLTSKGQHTVLFVYSEADFNPPAFNHGVAVSSL